MQKSSGFSGQLIIDVPKAARSKCAELPLINALYICRMGFYPKALYHYYQRPRGTSQVILLYCSGGKGWIQLAQQKLELKAGELFVIPKNCAHSYSADTKNPWTIHWFHLLGSQADEVVQALMGPPTEVFQTVQVGFSEERNELFKQIANTFAKGFSIGNLYYANQLFPHYLSTFITLEHFQQNNTESQAISLTERAIKLMQDNLLQSLSLEQIAQSVHLSTSFFSRKFKEDTGYAPIEYFNQLRIQRACQLLHFSQLRINEIALQIGISDPFYFSRLFKQQMGVSPAKYRKMEGQK